MLVIKTLLCYNSGLLNAIPSWKKKSAKTATKSQRKVKQSTVDHPDSSTGISKAIPVLKVLTLKGLDSKTQCRYKISPSMVKEKGHSPFYRNVH